MIYYFQTMDKHLDVYTWAIEGEQLLAEQHLQSLFCDVRYINAKEEDVYASYKHVLANGLIIRNCKFSHTIKSRQSRPTIHNNCLPFDNRHIIPKAEDGFHG